MPLLFARLLWVRRAELQKPETKKLLGVLYLSYKPDLYWFESVTMIFKLALWATLVFFEHGSQFQLAMSAVICVIQLGYHARFEPFEQRGKNVLQYLSYILVAFTSFSGLLLNYIKVSLAFAQVTFQTDEVSRLEARERDFKTCTAFIIWGGAALILLQVLYSAVRFTRKHGAAIRRLGSGVAHKVTQRLSKGRTKSQAMSEHAGGGAASEQQPGDAAYLTDAVSATQQRPVSIELHGGARAIELPQIAASLESEGKGEEDSGGTTVGSGESAGAEN